MGLLLLVVVEAGLMFLRAEQFGRAVLAFVESLHWKWVFVAAERAGYGSSRIQVLGQDLAERLRVLRRYADAATVLETYCNDLEGAVATLTEGELWVRRGTVCYIPLDLVGSTLLCFTGRCV